MAGHMDTEEAIEAIEQIKSIGTITVRLQKKWDKKLCFLRDGFGSC
jgi:hypothetical protein